MLMKTNCQIVGIMHPAKDGGSRMDRALGLVSHDKLILVPEPDNALDRNAILVYKASDPEHEIGHMASSAAKRICRMIECGATFSAEVFWIDIGKNGWASVHCSIEQLTPMTRTKRPTRYGAPVYRGRTTRVRSWTQDQKPVLDLVIVNQPSTSSQSQERGFSNVEHTRPDGVAANQHQQNTAKFWSAKRCTVLCCMGLVGGWVFSPLSWLSVICFLITAGSLAWSVVRKSYVTAAAMPCLFMLLFLVGGISRDVLDDVRPTAECSDGSYSFSAHQSGTCSWHGGVSEWSPTVHHWWQTLLAI